MGCLIQGPWAPLTPAEDTYALKHAKKTKAMLIEYLETQCAFRDYSILPKAKYGKSRKIAVHQQVYRDTMESDVENALYNFQRDGFGCIVFYV